MKERRLKTAVAKVLVNEVTSLRPTNINGFGK